MKTKSNFKNRSLAVILTTALLMVALPVTAVFAASSGPNYPGTAAGTGWTNPGNISADDTSYATYAIPASGTSNAINGTNYGFSIPAEATINGITVEIGRASSSAGGGNSINDSVVQLLKDGTATGNNKATSTDWPTSQGTATYGGASDLWGTTWTATDVNNANFGVTLSGVNQSGFSTRTASVDFIRITVTYNESGSGATNAGTGSDVTGVGTVTWSNPGNVVSNDNTYATAAVNGTQTHYLQATNYGFAIPSGSTILGIQSTIGRFENTTGGGADVRDVVVSLIKGGTVSGNNKAVTGTDWPTTETAATYGSSSDLWGLSWTADDINASNFGLALSVNSTNNRTASVDYMQISVTYTLPATTTGVNCASNPITYGGDTTCTATVTRGAGTNTPGGSVSFASDASGGFATSPCTLSDIGGGSASCSVTYTPSAVGDGSHLITASYAGDTNFLGSNGSQTVTVNKADPTLSVTNSPVTYDGTGKAATVSSNVAGTVSNILAGGAATQTDASTYAVTADFSSSDPNYNDLIGASAGNFVIDKATPTVSVTNSPVTYTGAQQAATVSGSVAGTVGDVKYDGSSTEPADAATYAVTADFTPTDTANYNSLSDASAGNFVIDKATPTVSVTNSPVTYNGAQQAAAVIGSVAGTFGDVKYDGSSTEPTDAATYAVTADFTPTDAANYNSLSDASAGNFVIDKATPTVSVTNSPVTYNGAQQAATVSGSVAGTVGDVKYDGSSTEPTDAATYAITADFNPTDTTNYNGLSDASAGNFVINKADPTLSVTNSPVIYDGTGKAATVSSNVAGTISNILTGGAATQTDAGTYAVTADFSSSDPNYNDLTDASAGNFVINKTDPTLSVTNTPVTYNGAPQAATITGSVAGTASNIQYDGSSTTPTNVGTYAITADFTSSDPNYNDLTSASAGNFIIDKLSINVTADNKSKLTSDPDYEPADFTFSYITLVGSDVPGDIDTPPTCDVAEDQSVAGIYDIVCSGGVDNNYTFTYTNGTLTVNAANNPPTDIGLSNSSVNENAAIGTTVGTLSATDPDVSDTFTYILVHGGGACPGTDNASFSILADALKTAAVFDFETKSSYVICVQTGDGNGGTFVEEFTIAVNNLSETTTTTFTSIAAHDGWLLESGENTNTGGTMSAAGTLFYLGDNAQKKQYRSILSFSTASLPDNAVITKVTLKVKQHSAVNAATPGMFQGFVTDIKTGPFGGVALALLDFKTVANKSVGPQSPALISGWYSINLTPGKSFINKLATKGGITQMRLRFKLDDNNNAFANYIKFFSGNAGAANRPQLIIQWRLP